MPFRRLRRHLCAFATLFLATGHAGAVVLDWDLVTWADGSLSNTYQADVTNPESNLTITITTNNLAPIVPFSIAPNPLTPTINNAFQGGLGTSENTLAIAVDLSDPLQSITITVNFAATGGATNVSFKLFDVDAGGPYQDQVSLIRALSIDGTTLIAPTITTSANNTLIGTGLNQSVVGTATTPDSGPNSGRANVTINFGASAIQSFTYTYGGTLAFLDPAYQHFSMHDINFTPVPEANPAVLSGLTCLVAVGFLLRQRVLIRRRTPR